MTRRYFTAENYTQFRDYIKHLGLQENCCVFVREPYLLKGLRDITLEVLPGSFENEFFQEIYRVALQRNLKVESVNV